MIDTARTKSLFQKLQRTANKLAKRADAEDVHDFRTTARRVETAIAELLPKPNRNTRKLRKQATKLRKRAGRVRDLDVQLVALESLNTGRDAAQKSFLMEALASDRRRREKKLLGALDSNELKSLRKRARRTAKEVLASKVNFDPVARALREFGDLARKQGEISEATLHPYRLRCKRIRYIAEMAGEQPGAEAIVEQLKKIQDAAGEWHDWQVLTSRAEEVFTDLPNPAMVSALRSVTHAKLMEALHVTQEARQVLLNMLSSAKAPKSVPRKRSRGELAAAAVA